MAYVLKSLKWHFYFNGLAILIINSNFDSFLTLKFFLVFCNASLKCYDLTGVVAIQWDSSSDWVMKWREGHKLFWKHRLGRWGWEVALYVREQLECMEFCQELMGKAYQCGFVGICYGPSDQEGVDKAFFRQLEEASCSQVLVFTGNLKQPDICWMDNTAGLNQLRKFLEYTDDNFLA